MKIESSLAKSYNNSSSGGPGWDYFYTEPILIHLIDTVKNNPPPYSDGWDYMQAGVPHTIYPLAHIRANDDIRWYGVLKREIARLISNNPILEEKIYYYDNPGGTEQTLPMGYNSYQYVLGIRGSFEIYDMREMIVPFNPYTDIFISSGSNSGGGSGGNIGGDDSIVPNPTD
ncbi:MAG: hypothetical protein ACO2O4_03690 [Minisyncoccia bacterium]|jgi:hypothetical protein